jgi:uncharacterized protein (DUF169 family)
MKEKKMNFTKLQKKSKKLLSPLGVPVGIKLLKNKDMIEEKKVMPLAKNRALCQLLKTVAVYEKTRGIYTENIDACVVGTYVMGFAMPPDDLKDRWVKGFAYTDIRFEQLSKQIEALPQNEYEAAIFAPLCEFDRLELEPEAIILLVNSCQSYLALMGYFDATGNKPKSSFNGHAACEIVAAVIKGESPWMTIPCGGARSIANSQDDELWLGFNPLDLELSLMRLEEMGLKYPPAITQMPVSDLNPDHPLTDLLVRET